ncbi:acyltransferase family protein [Epilithonimonas caeni]|uniref:acyltransferase family protein n=1 Tax=Epilithonimonas caeni TaxID=365343 RepID=UPI00041BB94F|nr:acyltransferase [Epilithonimonas caeni]
MLNNLTGLRFYTALWVFLYHFGVYIDGGENFLLKKGYLGVDIFFILSGFILTYAYYDQFFLTKITGKTYYNFILKRFAKIYPLQILTFILVGILLYVGKYLFHQKDLIIRNDHIISNLLMVHAWNLNDALSWNTHSWSLSDEWFAYLFLFVVSAFVVKVNKMIGKVLLSSIVVFFIVKWFRTDGFDLNNYTYNGLERIVPEFFLGVIVGLLRVDLQISKKAASVIFILSLALLLFIAGIDYHMDALCMIPFAGIIYSLSFNTIFDRGFNSKKLVYMGNISFAFYMLQLTAFYLFKPVQNYMGQMNLPEYVSIALELLGLIAINLIMASTVYRYFEEPVRLFLVRKLSKR